MKSWEQDLLVRQSGEQKPPGILEAAGRISSEQLHVRSFAEDLLPTKTQISTDARDVEVAPSDLQRRRRLGDRRAVGRAGFSRAEWLRRTHLDLAPQSISLNLPIPDVGSDGNVSESL